MSNSICPKSLHVVVYRFYFERKSFDYELSMIIGIERDRTKFVYGVDLWQNFIYKGRSIKIIVIPIFKCSMGLNWCLMVDLARGLGGSDLNKRKYLKLLFLTAVMDLNLFQSCCLKNRIKFENWKRRFCWNIYECKKNPIFKSDFFFPLV